MPTASKDKYTEAVGRRKTSTARVRIVPAKENKFSINDKDLETYFVSDELRNAATAPLRTEDVKEKYSITVRVNGGGIHSQAEAVSHGLARAIQLLDPEMRKPLKQDGLLTRDPRMKERRKFGLKKARKSPQWSKR